MQAEGSVGCCCVAAYCTGIPLLLDAVLLISIQLLIREILGMLIEFFLKFRTCTFLVEFGLTCKVVRLGALLSCAIFHPLRPVLLPVTWFLKLFSCWISFQQKSRCCICEGSVAYNITAKCFHFILANSSFYLEICHPLNILYYFWCNTLRWTTYIKINSEIFIQRQ